ncbi:hypothetical protein MY1884_004702 [Beauveria asiatica]
MSIRPLPKDVIEKITASSSIVSLNGAVCGLVRNSLDAGARKVNIVLDYVRGNCTVEDDGEGISAEEFSVNGGLAKPNTASNGSLSVDGCISTIPVATRTSQFISLGIHPLERPMGGNVLFEEVNEIFTSSSFGILEDHGSSETSADDPSVAQCKPKKGLERWPMFYLRFKSNATDAEDLLRPRSPTLAAIISLLRAVCYAFLRKYKMRPRKRMHNRRRFSPVEGGGQSLQDGRPGAEVPRPSEKFLCTFDNWRRIKVGHRAGGAFPQSSKNLKHLIGSGGQLLRLPFVEESHDESFTHSLCSDADNDLIHNFSTRNMEKLETHCREGNENWLAKLDKSWKNPVFETVESAVHRLPNELCFELCEDSKRTSASTTNISGRIAKSSLANADIIAQVDRKFVLIKLPLVSPLDDKTFTYKSVVKPKFSRLPAWHIGATSFQSLSRCNYVQRRADIGGVYFAHPTTCQMLTAFSVRARPAKHGTSDGAGQ